MNKGVNSPKGSPFVLVSSPFMHDLGDSIQAELKRKGLDMPHYRINFSTFANKEFLPQVMETIRGQHIFFLHPFQYPDPNAQLVKMMLAHDAMRRASVRGITLVAPYLSYMRQDRKDRPRVPISARVVADAIEMNKSVERVITIDMHAMQEQGFFSIPVDNLTGYGLFAKHILSERHGDLSNTMVVSPDFGGVTRARSLAQLLKDLPVGICEKRRPKKNASELVTYIGQPVKDMRVIMYDDMIDTGGSIRNVASKLCEMGAKEVSIYATHGIFSGGAEKKFASEKRFKITCTDSIPRRPQYSKKNTWLKKLSIGPLFAEAIFEASLVGGSISKLSQ